MVEKLGVFHYALENYSGHADGQFRILCMSAYYSGPFWRRDQLVRRPFATCIRCLGIENQRGQLLEEWDDARD